MNPSYLDRGEDRPGDVGKLSLPNLLAGFTISPQRSNASPALETRKLLICRTPGTVEKKRIKKTGDDSINVSMGEARAMGKEKKESLPEGERGKKIQPVPSDVPTIYCAKRVERREKRRRKKYGGEILVLQSTIFGKKRKENLW